MTTPPIEIDAKGIAWAFMLGVSMRQLTKGTVGIRAREWCPFREGTPHYDEWYRGWRR